MKSMFLVFALATPALFAEPGGAPPSPTADFEKCILENGGEPLPKPDEKTMKAMQVCQPQMMGGDPKGGMKAFQKCMQEQKATPPPPPNDKQRAAFKKCREKLRKAKPS